MSSSIAIVLSEKVNNSLLRVAEECVLKAVNYCAEKYNFPAEEALKELGVMSIEVAKKGGKGGKKVVNKVATVKPSIPLPYNGEMNAECCSALRQNNGLYTQCTSGRRKDSDFCKGCAGLMQKRGAEVPEYGTIKMRNAVGIFEYVDPKGRKPVSYTKVMKKYKLTQGQVMEEAKKLNISINPQHFEVSDTEGVKRGRPKTVEKEAKEKGSRGRPKKTKKVLEVDGDADDLFASLVANANEEVSVSEVKSEDEEKLKKEKLAAEKAEKLAAEKAEKLAKKEAERLAREEKKKAEEEEKAALALQKKAAAEQAKKEKELAAEQAKKEKEAKLAAKEAAKKEKEASKSSNKVEKKVSKKVEKEAGEKVADEEEPDVVKKIEFEGKKYLKSKKTGIIYDYEEYANNGEQVVVGKWNDKSNKIEFSAQEEDEEEYEM
jgi:hypothetical protein